MSVYNKYKIDLKKYRAEIIDSFCHVYGDKHRKIFEERFDRMYINWYITGKDLKDYIDKIKEKRMKSLKTEMIEGMRMISNPAELYETIQAFEREYAEEVAEVEKYKELERKIYRKNHREYLKVLKENFPKKPKEDAGVYQNRLIYIDNLLENFSSRGEEVLKSGTPKVLKIIKDRTRYKDIVGAAPSVELADRICALKEIADGNYETELLASAGTYIENKKAIAGLGLAIDPSLGFGHIMKLNKICMSHDGVRKGNKIEPLPVVHLPALAMKEYCEDIQIIHEIGHALTYEIVETNVDIVKIKSGLKTFTFNMKDAKKIEEENLIVEIIHHAAIIEVVKHLHSKGIYIKDDPKTAIVEGCIDYERQYVVVEPFYKKYKQAILDACVTDSYFKNLINIISKENFDALNRLVIEHKDLISKNLPEGEETKFLGVILGIGTSAGMKEKKLLSGRDKIMAKIARKERDFE